MFISLQRVVRIFPSKRFQKFKLKFPFHNLALHYESRAWFQLSAGRGFRKIGVLAKSRNPWKLKLIQVTLQWMVLIFLYVLKHVKSLVIWKLQYALKFSGKLRSTNLFQTLRFLAIKHRLNNRLNNKTSCGHDRYTFQVERCFFRLCITVFILSLLAKTAVSPLSSLLTVRRLTVSK